MNTIIQALQSVQPYLEKVWIVIMILNVITIVPTVLFVLFYWLSKKFTNKPVTKIYIALICTTLLVSIIYFALMYVLNKYGIIIVNIYQLYALTVVAVAATYVDAFILLLVCGILVIIINIIKAFIRRIYYIKSLKQHGAKVSNNSETSYNENMGNEFTQTVSKFTSNYLKSFMREGKPINRLQIMLDNKEDYIGKLTEICVSNDPNNTVNSRKVAEFYYNYYVKIFSE